ncbi:MAG TPA: serine hydrolase domain-containing protein [Kiloniellales bacterium]|nr:serine hydrolase domain-containing protein [Kiloniellales bacterium]
MTRRRLLQGGAALAAALGSGAARADTAADDQRFQATVDLLSEGVEAHRLTGYIPGAAWTAYWRGRVHTEATGEQAIGGAPMQPDSIFRIASISKPVTATAAMILVEEGKLGLDDPVDRFLPELADRQVLRRIDGPLDDTVPAVRPITLADLLTMRFGLGAIMVWPPAYPIQAAMAERGLAPSAEIFSAPPDEFMKRLGELPLAAQPGEAFLYHTGLDVAGVLIERVVGTTLGAFLQERIFGPLGMKDTAFFVPPEKVDRLVTAYRADPATKELEVFDEAAGGRFSKPPAFEAGGAGLVSTAGDYLAFERMLLGGGESDGVRILSPESVAAMTEDHLTPAQKEAPNAALFFQEGGGWGYGMAAGPVRYGWIGGYGTWAYVYPRAELIGVLLTQRVLDSPDPPSTMADFAAVLDDLAV